jgi:N-acetylglucosaminyl-diphospho-decaprenol L-rhamnosyltransferase
MTAPFPPAVVIVTHDTRDEVLGCLASIRPGEAAQIVVVDSGSTDDTGEAVRRERPDVRVIRLANVGFGRGANCGLRATHAEHVVVCNADVRFTPGALPALAGRLEADGEVAAVGPLVRYPDGTVQASARCMPDVRTAVVHGLLGRVAPDNAATRRYHVRDEPIDRPRDVDWLSGCVLALRRTAVDEVGGFDPGYFLYVEDVDLGQRLRSRGWRLRYEPCARVVHTVGASTSQQRGRSLLAHARSLDRYQSMRLGRGPARMLIWPLRVALAGWVVGTWVAERFTRDARSVTGERLVDPMPDAPPPLALLSGELPPLGTDAGGVGKADRSVDARGT